MKYAVTGPSRDLSREEMLHVARIVQAQTRAIAIPQFLSGAARGVDAIAGVAAILAFGPEQVTWVIPAVPTTRYDSITVAQYPAHTLTMYGPSGQTHAEAFMARNDYLVANCDVLLAFPETAKEERRSGTWATIRRARKAGKPVFLYPLSDAAPVKEDDDT